MSYRIVFLGAGNLATRLSEEFYKKGFSIVQVYSRTQNSARALAQKLQTNYTTSVQEILPDADMYFVALKDSAFEDVLPYTNFQNKLLVHCSGSMPMAALEKYSQNFGVLYPLQTFSKQRPVNFAEIPVFVEANSKENEGKLIKIAREISNSVSLLNSEKRLYLHIAAVFACNFVNHFYDQASEILKSQDIPFDVLKPLIAETAQKVEQLEPFHAQTGPAVRYDDNIISKHLDALESIPSAHELYKSISKSIFEHHQKNS